ncbi:hypothetical protein HanPSC8_Chr02g0051021 [Helianthus annuus]|nr:hypothetical protein HanPSC8_Chr02g0051021 [Helianthus annuus]
MELPPPLRNCYNRQQICAEPRLCVMDCRRSESSPPPSFFSDRGGCHRGSRLNRELKMWHGMARFPAALVFQGHPGFRECDSFLDKSQSLNCVYVMFKL